MELEPDNVDALTGIATVDASIATLLLADDADVRLETAETALSRALCLSPHHAWAHMVLGVVQMGSNRAEQGIAEFEHALALNRNLVEAHAYIGLAKILAGRAAETERHIHEALRLSPLDGAAHRWMSWAGLAKLLLGADAEAVVRIRRSLKGYPNHPISYSNPAKIIADGADWRFLNEVRRELGG